MIRKATKKWLAIALALCLAGVFLVSCAKSDGQPFLAQLDSVDAFIWQGQTADAMRLLKQAEKNAFSAFARLGIYRRYLTLGERRLAETVLRNGLAALRDNAELTAVYTQFLLRENRLDEAVAQSRILAETRYGSLYAEATLKKADALLKHSGWYAQELASVYYDAYIGTKNTRWLMNSALVSLLQGDYHRAALLQPDQPRSMAEQLFWSYVQYDAGYYDRCLDNLSRVRSEVLLPVAAELASDAYMMLDDRDGAERSRQVVLRYKGEHSAEIPPSVKVNSALWEQAQGQYQQAYDLIFDVVTNVRLYVPGLITYGRFAYESSLPPVMTDLEKSLRMTPLRTHALQAYDDRPKILMSDALYRMEVALAEQQETTGEKDEDLLVAYLLLSEKNNPGLTPTANIAFVWKALEENERGRSLYPPKLVQLAVRELLSNGQTEDARRLFTNYVAARYRLEDDEVAVPEKRTDVFGGERIVSQAVIPPEVLRGTFGDRAAKIVHGMEIWEGECAAYFALLDGNVSAARRLYEYVLFETGGLHRNSARAQITSISPLSSPVSAINLAMMYSSTGNKKDALALYGLAAGRTRESHAKADILYRTAVIQHDTGDKNGALLSLEYCLALNPTHADARLLRKTIGN
ncbi:MAG: hypothetical protein K2J50_05580 [Treponemataceae bacterium]|nr:hypothetical protein [Treponemataceae bacterium]